MATKIFQSVQLSSNLDAVRFSAQQWAIDLTTLRERLMSAWKCVLPEYYGLPQKSNFWDGVGMDARQSVGMARNCQNKAVGHLYNPLKMFGIGTMNWNRINTKIPRFTKCQSNRYPDFYVGITDNVERRLREHKVDQSSPNSCMYFNAYDKKSAESAERHLLRWGMKGNPGGGNERSVYVYCYKITPHTCQ